MPLDSMQYAKKLALKRIYSKKIISKSSRDSSPFLMLVNNHDLQERPILEINKKNLDQIFKCEKIN